MNVTVIVLEALCMLVYEDPTKSTLSIIPRYDRSQLTRIVVLHFRKLGLGILKREDFEANATHIDSSSVDFFEAEFEEVGDGYDHTCDDKQRSIRRGEDEHDHPCHSTGTHPQTTNHQAFGNLHFSTWIMTDKNASVLMMMSDGYAEGARRRAMANVVRVARKVQRGFASTSGLSSEHSESASQEGSGGSVLRIRDRRRGETAGASAAQGTAQGPRGARESRYAARSGTGARPPHH